ncbi:hypothetical protein D1007_04490 [Hordeum vulgare]|nr:hypothetical protein D1007_04490 [Hordeum vulgare]
MAVVSGGGSGKTAMVLAPAIDRIAAGERIGTGGTGSRMDKIVNIHYVDKEAFMNVDIIDNDEEELIFLKSPTYEEVVEETRIRLNVTPIDDHKVEVEVNEYPQYEFECSAPIKDDGHDSDEEYERHHNIVGDVEAQVRHDDMDPDIVYQRACVDELDDEGLVNELDEDGFTKKEAEWYGVFSTQQSNNEGVEDTEGEEARGGLDNDMSRP